MTTAARVKGSWMPMDDSAGPKTPRRPNASRGLSGASQRFPAYHDQKMRSCDGPFASSREKTPVHHSPGGWSAALTWTRPAGAVIT